MIAAVPRTASSVRRDETCSLLHMAIHNPPLAVLNQTVRSELGSFFLEAQYDATVRCVVFESGKRSFCAGADLR
jgi:enoyl-CoA hydratase/carnithine racemase